MDSIKGRRGDDIQRKTKDTAGTDVSTVSVACMASAGMFAVSVLTRRTADNCLDSFESAIYGRRQRTLIIIVDQYYYPSPPPQFL